MSIANFQSLYMPLWHVTGTTLHFCFSISVWPMLCSSWCNYKCAENFCIEVFIVRCSVISFALILDYTYNIGIARSIWWLVYWLCIGKRFLSSPNLPDRLWGPTSFPSIGPGGPLPGPTVDHPRPSSVEVKNGWSYNSAPPYAFMARTETTFSFFSVANRFISLSVQIIQFLLWIL